MRLKVNQIEIPSDDPFANDALDRKDEISNITQLLVNVESPMVLAVDSKWGTGKTTFIKMWEYELANQGIFSLYFNAWETDFAEDPLIAFLGELNSSINQYLKKDSGKKQLWEKTKKIGGQIAKRSLPVAVKLGTAGLIDTDQILEKEIAGISQKLAEDAVNSFHQTKELTERFKKNLKELFATHSEENHVPIFIFIDELDRCRPNYALELLERVKHILDIKNLIFILSIDKKQLCNSIQAVYGHNIDSIGYLRRFIDIEYSLKKPNRERYINNIFEKFGLINFFDSRKEFNNFQYEKDSFLKLFNIMAVGFSLSLREIEQFFTKMYIVILSTKKDVHLYTPLLVALIFLKEKNPKLYEKFSDNGKNADDVVRFFRAIIDNAERVKIFPFARLEGFIIASRGSRYDINNSEIILDHQKTLANDTSTDDEKYYADRVILIAKEPIDWRSGIAFDNLIKRVEMAEQFNIKEEKNS